MQYKLISNITNDSSAVTELTHASLRTLTDGVVDSGVITLTDGDTLTIICDLENRYFIDSIKYYHSSGGTVTISISESLNVWDSVSVDSEAYGSSSDLSDFTYKPRWVKISHSVSSGSVDVYEVEIYNSDVNILFGPAGEYASYGLDAINMTTQRVDVYNQTDTIRDLYLFIDDSSSTDADDLLKYGLTSSGIFYGKRDSGLNLPTDFSWSSGQHEGTYENIDGYLIVSGTLSSGTYYSPVIDTSSYSNTRFFWGAVSDGDLSIDFSSSIDSEECFGVRRYYIPPSGTWSDGNLSDSDDYLWSVPSGSLSFLPMTNNSIMNFIPHNYLQFAVTITGTATIYKAGIESPLVLETVAPYSSRDFYVASASGTTSGKTAYVQCWYKE